MEFDEGNQKILVLYLILFKSSVFLSFRIFCLQLYGFLLYPPVYLSYDSVEAPLLLSD